MTLTEVLLTWSRDRRANRFVPVEYLGEYWSIVAFTDGYFLARGHQPDAGWDLFKAWLSAQGIVEGSEGWRLAVPRLAEKLGRSPAELLFELLERFDREPRA